MNQYNLPKPTNWVCWNGCCSRYEHPLPIEVAVDSIACRECSKILYPYSSYLRDFRW